MDGQQRLELNDKLHNKDQIPEPAVRHPFTLNWLAPWQVLERGEGLRDVFNYLQYHFIKSFARCKTFSTTTEGELDDPGET